jgi:hypothetical protein
VNRTLLALAALVASVPGCRPLSKAEAVKVVRTYNGAVIEALRSGDARLIDPVTGPEEGRKLTGLIGVKLDQGITMDATLLDFRVLDVAYGRNEAIVSTEERWQYRELRIGTGEQVGPESRDHYFMRYHVRRPEKRWVVDRIEYASPPEVGRKEIWGPGDVPAGAGGMGTSGSGGSAR